MVISETHGASLTSFLLFFLQICGQVQYGDRERHSVIKREPGWSQQTEEQNKEVEDWAKHQKRFNLHGFNPHGPESPPAAFNASTRVLKRVKTLGVWRWKDGKMEGIRGGGSRIWSTKQSFGGLAAPQDRSPAAGATLGGDASLNFFELNKQSAHGLEGSIKDKDMGTDVRPFGQPHQERLQWLISHWSVDSFKSTTHLHWGLKDTYCRVISTLYLVLNCLSMFTQMSLKLLCHCLIFLCIRAGICCPA